MESMKIYITEYTHQGKTEEGPILYAHSMSEAQEVADEYGLEVVGELTDIYVPPKNIWGDRTIH